MPIDGWDITFFSIKVLTSPSISSRKLSLTRVNLPRLNRAEHSNRNLLLHALFSNFSDVYSLSAILLLVLLLGWGGAEATKDSRRTPKPISHDGCCYDRVNDGEII